MDTLSETDNIEILEVNPRFVSTEDEQTEDDESYYTANSDSEEGSVNEEFEFESSDSDDDVSSGWEYEIIEQPVESDGDEQAYTAALARVNECMRLGTEPR